MIRSPVYGVRVQGFFVPRFPVQILGEAPAR